MISPEAVGKALKSISAKLAEDMKRREANDYIFTVQINCTFPQYHHHSTSDSIKTIPKHTLRGSYIFTSKMPREEIKEKIWEVEETLIKTYETEIMKRYGVKYSRLLKRRIEYELEIEKR